MDTAKQVIIEVGKKTRTAKLSRPKTIAEIWQMFRGNPGVMPILTMSGNVCRATF